MSHRRSSTGPLLAAAFATALLPTFTANIAHAQGDGTRANRVSRGLSIGDHPRVDGLRLNFRDRELDLVRGANVTIWRPYDNVGGTVQGLALGLPMTGAGNIEGFGVGALGLVIEEDARGIMLGGIGVGAGGELRGLSFGGIGVGAGGQVRGISVGGIGVGAGGGVRGIALGGIGVGSGGGVRGIAVGGIGVGAGGDVRGLMAGGIGAAAGGNARGILIGGVGAGVGGNLRGIAIGGVGVGAGGDARGLLLGGVGVGAGGEVRGIAIGGVGVGAGEGVNGIAIGGLGVGAPRIEGVAVGALVRAERVRGMIVAPLMFRSFDDADVDGFTASGVNIVYGHQRGLAIALVNYAESMSGLQLGAINIIRDNPAGRRVLPFLNWGR